MVAIKEKPRTTLLTGLASSWIRISCCASLSGSLEKFKVMQQSSTPAVKSSVGRCNTKSMRGFIRMSWRRITHSSSAQLGIPQIRKVDWLLFFPFSKRYQRQIILLQARRPYYDSTNIHLLTNKSILILQPPFQISIRMIKGSYLLIRISYNFLRRNLMGRILSISSILLMKIKGKRKSILSG